MDKIEKMYFDCENITDNFIINMLKESVLDANELVFKLEKTDEKYKGMGTTVVVVFIYNNKAYYISIGDSRLYTLDSGLNRLSRVTEDDTYVNELLKKRVINAAEAKNHPQKHILTKAIGVFEKLEVIPKKMDMSNVKYLLLFSDGATNTLRRAEMLKVFKDNKFEDWADKIVESANSNGCSDNITVIAVEIEE